MSIPLTRSSAGDEESVFVTLVLMLIGLVLIAIIVAGIATYQASSATAKLGEAITFIQTDCAFQRERTLNAENMSIKRYNVDMQLSALRAAEARRLPNNAKLLNAIAAEHAQLATIDMSNSTFLQNQHTYLCPGGPPQPTVTPQTSFLTP